jgi:hypothetical protein
MSLETKPRDNMSMTPDKVEQALQSAVDHGSRAGLTPDEMEALREVLEWWRGFKAWRAFGKQMLWLITALGATAVAIRELRAAGWLP